MHIPMNSFPYSGDDGFFDLYHHTTTTAEFLQVWAAQKQYCAVLEVLTSPNQQTPLDADSYWYTVNGEPICHTLFVERDDRFHVIQKRYTLKWDSTHEEYLTVGKADILQYVHQKED